MKNDEERQGKRRKFEIERKYQAPPLKKLSISQTNKKPPNQKPKISLEFFFSSR
jgi:hypothetical protein